MSVDESLELVQDNPTNLRRTSRVRVDNIDNVDIKNNQDDDNHNVGPGGVRIVGGSRPVLPEGKGKQLKDFAGISYEINKRQSSDPTLQSFHFTLFGRTYKKFLKSDILSFNGYIFPEDLLLKEKEKETITFRLYKSNLPLIKDLAKLLHLQSSGTKEEIIDKIIDFICVPVEEKLAVSGDKILKKRKSSTNTKKTSKKLKTKNKPKTNTKSNKPNNDNVDDKFLSKDYVNESDYDEVNDEIDEETDNDSEDEDYEEKSTSIKKSKKKPKKKVVKQSNSDIDDDIDDDDIDGDEDGDDLNAQEPNKEAIKEETIKIIQNGNLNNLTLRVIRNELKNTIFNGKDLTSDEKNIVKVTVESYLNSH